MRYDLADLDRFLETKKRRTLPPEPQPMREQRAGPVHEPEPRLVEPWEREPEPPGPLRHPRSPLSIPMTTRRPIPLPQLGEPVRGVPRGLLRRLKLRQHRWPPSWPLMSTAAIPAAHSTDPANSISGSRRRRPRRRVIEPRCDKPVAKKRYERPDIENRPDLNSHTYLGFI